MAESSNTIEFIIRAKDEAEKVFDGIRKSINQTKIAQIQYI